MTQILTGGAVPVKAKAVRQLLRDMLAGQPGADAALFVERPPLPDQLLAGVPMDRFSGLADGVPIGPVIGADGVSRWFDAFLPAQQVIVRLGASPAPALVATNARPLTASPLGRRTLRLDPGTVWIRANLVGTGFPAGSYVGVRHHGGTLRLNQLAPLSGSVITAAEPFQPTLDLTLAADASTPAEGGCSSASPAIELPPTLRLAFTADGVVATSAAGTASVWNQTFTAVPVAGAARWTFAPRLWAAVVPFEVTPSTLDTTQVDSALVRLGGIGTVAAAA